MHPDKSIPVSRIEKRRVIKPARLDMSLFWFANSVPFVNCVVQAAELSRQDIQPFLHLRMVVVGEGFVTPRARFR